MDLAVIESIANILVNLHPAIELRDDALLLQFGLGLIFRQDDQLALTFDVQFGTVCAQVSVADRRRNGDDLLCADAIVAGIVAELLDSVIGKMQK